MAVSRDEQAVFEPLKIIPNIMNIHRISNFFPYNFKYGKRVTRYQELDIYDDKYEAIEKLFEKSQCKLSVDRVVKVYNPYLKKEFELKRQLHYKSVRTLALFHGTKDEHVDSICEYNFDWRYSGKQGHRFGKGVHFTTSPSFASTFSDQGPYKVIIMANVLVKNTCEGNETLVVPPPGYDTAIAKNDNGMIYVKFDDNEFYPSYLIHCFSD